MTILQKLAVLLVAMGVAFGSAWQVQTWRYDGKLANQAQLHLADLSSISNAATAQVQAEQDKRLDTEQRLLAADQQHSREFTDAQRNQAALRDRLATADLRLSVLLDATDSASRCDVPATPGTVGVVHAARRTQLDPAHAQRVIGITDAGDQGLIALRACQAYAKAVSVAR
ncbi:lysis system i-spanin subunit Rz [uncultured Pseudomonas sp.]|uniref:lysis system i-spanin subunit Rz n=1 Tax=uncultured Pseudomonas sp. TaxID=114707 RepID=UPI0020530687|nr:lysis system i-spanin subunit Rz [uncultured Pseudomonas sp.]DAK19350.1 MAG TPA: Rz lysis protein [Caudoviricetes sp.]